MKAHLQQVAHSQQTSFVYRVKADKRFGRGVHCHPEYELTYIQRSHGRRFVGDSMETYSSGDLVLLGSNLPHTWRSDDTRNVSKRSSLHRAIVVQFLDSFLGGDFLQRPEMSHVARLLQQSSRGLHVTGHTRTDVAARLRKMKSLDRFDRLIELLATLDRLAHGGKDLRPICSTHLNAASTPSTQRRLDRVFACLHERFAGNVSQSDVAALAGMSPASFSRFFRRSTGRTFVQYLGDLRISRACELLIETDLSILQISHAAGYNNLSNFNRQFLQRKGVAPRSYRLRWPA